MKVKAVVSICKKSKVFSLYDDISPEGEVGAQWLGDMGAAYPLAGFPLLEEKTIYTMFDITEKQAEKIHFQRGPLPEAINFKHTDSSERMLDEAKLSIGMKGRTLMPLQTTRGLVFIDTAYLAPFADIADMLELYERTMPSGQVYIAAKTGLLLAGIILPFQAINKQFVEQLDALLAQCRIAYEENQKRATVAPQ